MQYTYDYPRPMMTADTVLFRCKDKIYEPGATFDVLVVKRKNEPFQGKFALPGGYVNEGEDPYCSAARECLEETGIDLYNKNIETFPLPKLFGGIGRDPRGWTISVVMIGFTSDLSLVPIANDDAEEAKFLNLTFDALHKYGLSMLAFDHASIILSAYFELCRCKKISNFLRQLSILHDGRIQLKI